VILGRVNDWHILSRSRLEKYLGSARVKYSYVIDVLNAQRAIKSWPASVSVTASPRIMGRNKGWTHFSRLLIQPLLQVSQGLVTTRPMLFLAPHWVVKSSPTLPACTLNWRGVGHSRAIHLASTSSFEGAESLRWQNGQVGCFRFLFAIARGGRRYLDRTARGAERATHHGHQDRCPQARYMRCCASLRLDFPACAADRAPQ
jgi:hypothetical protein